MAKVIHRERWLALLEEQDGVVSRKQCLHHGITADAIRGHLRERRWRRLDDGVFLTHNGPLTHRARVWSVLLAIGDPCVAAGPTALWLATMRRPGPPPAEVHVGVLDGRRVLPRSRVVVHHYPDLGEERVQWTAAPPRVRVEQAVLDNVHRCRTPEAIVAAIGTPIGSGLTTTARLRQRLATRPRMRNRALVEAILADVAIGVRSPLEWHDLANDRRHGISGGQRQVIYRDVGGVVVIDVVYSGAGLRREVVKELDGLEHAEGEGPFRDMTRDNAAEERDQSHLRYGWEGVFGTPCESAAQLIRVLRLQGWCGTFHPCGIGCAVAAIAA